MRIAIFGINELSIRTAKILIGDGHQVIIIDPDKEKIEEHSEKLDCSFLLGDASKPEILQEVNPKQTDILFCLSDDDQHNIIASLVARQSGIGKVIPRIEDSDLENICLELGLKDTILPSRTISRYLKDMITHENIVELSTILKYDARFFSFLASQDEAGDLAKLSLPKNAHAICLYRSEEFILLKEGSTLQKDDEVVILCHADVLPELNERFGLKEALINNEKAVR